MVTLELIPENEDQFFQRSLTRLNDKKYKLFIFRNPPLPQINTFSLGQKECAYYGKSAYYEYAYHEWAQKPCNR